jgi:hypothetical protein
LSNSFKEEYDLRKFEKSIIHRYKLKKSQEEELNGLEDFPIDTNIEQEQGKQQQNEPIEKKV